MIGKNGQLNIRTRRKVSVRDLYYDYLNMNWLSFLGHFASVFISIHLVFGFLYFSVPESQFLGFRSPQGLERFLECFFFSVQTFGTIGYGLLSPVGVISNSIVTLESFVSLFVIALLTGLIFSRFAKPHSKVMFTEKAVIRDFDGVDCLMFRLANARQNNITEAKISLNFVYFDPATQYRNFYEMKLERDRSPLVSLTWTIAHDIDEASPLKKLPLNLWAAHNAEIIVTFSGIDTNLSQHIYAKTSYIVDEILCDHDFVDMIKRGPDGMAELEFEKFNQVKKLNA